MKIIDENETRKIKLHRQAGWTVQKIARKFGYHHSTICRRLKRCKNAKQG